MFFFCATSSETTGGHWANNRTILMQLEGHSRTGARSVSRRLSERIPGWSTIPGFPQRTPTRFSFSIAPQGADQRPILGQHVFSDVSANLAARFLANQELEQTEG